MELLSKVFFQFLGALGLFAIFFISYKITTKIAQKLGDEATAYIKNHTIFFSCLNLIITIFVFILAVNIVYLIFY